SAGPVPAGADTGVRRVGAIARAFPCGVDDAAIDPGLGLLIELNESIPGSDGCPNNAPAAFAIAAFSTSQLRLVARTQLAIQAGQSFEGATRSVVDAVHHRLFVATNGAGHDSVNVFSLPALLSAHGPVTPRVIALSGSPPAQSSHQNPTGSAGDATLGQAIGQIAADSIAYDPRTDALDVLTHATSSPTSTRAPGVASDVYVFEFNATSGKPLWTAFLGDCISAQSAASVSVGDQPAPLMRLRLGG